MGTGPMYRTEQTGETADMSAVLAELSSQPFENINTEKKKTADISAVLGVLMGTGPMYRDEQVGKTGDTSPVSPPVENPQYVENTRLRENKTGDMSPVLGLQNELMKSLQNGTGAVYKEESEPMTCHRNMTSIDR